MTRIGLLSDTHSYLDTQLFSYFADCDEVWHAGDVGDLSVWEQLRAFKPIRAVCGNIDAPSAVLPLHQRFEVEGLTIWMTHIGGSPPRYNRSVYADLKHQPPNMFVCGHSHILKVIRDPALHNMLYLNPGAAGKTGFHTKRTALRFSIDTGKLTQMEAIELGFR